MKPHVLITRPVSPSAIEMLSSVCDTLPRVAMNRPHQPNFRLIAECTDALLLGTTEHVDDALLRAFPRLRVVACTFRLPEHIDVAGDQMIFGHDHHRIAKLEQHFQTAPGELLLLLHQTPSYSLL